MNFAAANVLASFGPRSVAWYSKGGGGGKAGASPPPGKGKGTEGGKSWAKAKAKAKGHPSAVKVPTARAKARFQPLMSIGASSHLKEEGHGTNGARRPLTASGQQLPP